MKWLKAKGCPFHEEVSRSLAERRSEYVEAGRSERMSLGLTYILIPHLRVKETQQWVKQNFLAYGKNKVWSPEGWKKIVKKEEISFILFTF